MQPKRNICSPLSLSYYFYEFSKSYRFICSSPAHVIFCTYRSLPSGQLSCTRGGAPFSGAKASLYYTTDGSQPTSQSQRYKNLFILIPIQLLKGSAYKEQVSA
ncbi:chitobiase/beta-hexosaminidase C-terminal domain-containing protein [Bacillus sp. SL00103]